MEIGTFISCNSLGITTFLLYSISTIHYLIMLIKGSEKVTRVGLHSARVGFLINLLYIIMNISSEGSGVLFTSKGVFSLSSISIVSVFLYFTAKHKLSITGPFLMPWAAITAGVSAFSSGIPRNSFPVGIAGTVHIVTAFVAYASFLFSALISIVYLIFDRQLKKRKISIFYHKIPSLPLIENIVYRTIAVGFTFITLSMFAGAIWSEKLFGTYWSWHPKQVATLISWFIYASILHIYTHGKWNGKRLCYLSIAGIFLIVFDFIGVNLIGSDVHSF